MIRISRKGIEAIAIRVTDAYKKMDVLKNEDVNRIDPELLCTNLLKLKVDYHHLSKNGTILGLTSYNSCEIEIYDKDSQSLMYDLDGKTILVESDLKSADTIGRCNFTLAHEASHQIFNILYPKEYGVNAIKRQVHYYKKEQKITYPVTDWLEWQANALASAILLPEDFIKRGMLIFNLGEKIKVLNKVFREMTYNRFCDLAIFLGCSKTALAIRMKQLGLIEHDNLDDPYAIIEITR